jgi:hypothetical protein
MPYIQIAWWFTRQLTNSNLYAQSNEMKGGLYTVYYKVSEIKLLWYPDDGGSKDL